MRSGGRHVLDAQLPAARILTGGLVGCCALLSVGVALHLAACSNAEPVMVVRTPDPSRQHVGSFGLLTLMETERPGQDPCLKLYGQFVHYAHLHPEAVVRAIDPEMGRLPNEGVLGQCSVLRNDERPIPADGGAGSQEPFSIELLDAGGLTVRSPYGTLEIEPRPFPDMLASVGGVVYGSSAADCIPLAGEGELVVQSAGGRDVGAFFASLPMPQRLEIVAVDGIAPEDGQVVLGRPLDGVLPVQWQEPESSGDVFHIELESGDWRLLCLVPDTGSFSVPASSLSSAPKSGPVHLRVRRIHVQPFTAPGIREGEIVTIAQEEVTLAPAEP